MCPFQGVFSVQHEQKKTDSGKSHGGQIEDADALSIQRQRSNDGSDSKDQQNVEDIAAENISQRYIMTFLDDSGNGDCQLGHTGTESHNGR